MRYEPGKRWQKVDPKRHHYKNGYLVTAQFLFWLEWTNDHNLVRKLNADLRAGVKSDDLIRKHLGRSAEDCWKQYVEEQAD